MDRFAAADNPADLATRGSTVTEIRSTPIWWEGPHWLGKKDSWSDKNPQEISSALLEQINEEVTGERAVITLSTAPSSQRDLKSPFSAVDYSPFKIDVTGVSSLSVLLRRTAWCMNFVSMFVWSRLSD